MELEEAHKALEDLNKAMEINPSNSNLLSKRADKNMFLIKKEVGV